MSLKGYVNYKGGDQMKLIIAIAVLIVIVLVLACYLQGEINRYT